MLGPVEASSANGPPGPVVERCTSNPFSFEELSCHVTTIWLYAKGTALVAEGALTAGPPPLDRASTEGSSSRSSEQPPSDSSTRGTASDARQSVGKAILMGLPHDQVEERGCRNAGRFRCNSGDPHDAFTRGVCRDRELHAVRDQLGE